MFFYNNCASIIKNNNKPTKLPFTETFKLIIGLINENNLKSRCRFEVGWIYKRVCWYYAGIRMEKDDSYGPGLLGPV